MSYLVWSLPFVVNSGHVVLHAGMRDKGLWATFSRTPEDQNMCKSQEKVKIWEASRSLVWPFPAVVELMSGELVAGAEALAAALAGERLLPSQRESTRDPNNTRGSPGVPSHLHLPIPCVCKDEPRASTTY